MVDKQKTEKNTQTAVDQVFEKRRKIKMKFDFIKAKPLIFLLACLSGFLLIVFMVVASSASKVKVISVQGNSYFSVEEIEKIAGVSKKDIFYFLFPSRIEERLEKSIFISDAQVTLHENNIVKIKINEEAPIAYRYDDKAEILLKNGQLVEMDEKYLHLIARIPYLQGFDTEDQLYALTRSFRDVKQEVIEMISEISRYPMTYDENMIQLLMMDGNYFFSSYFSMETLNAYPQIASELVENGVCIYADESLQVAYTSECPWDIKIEEKEYWYDDLGNVMVNEYGDPIEKKYYRDELGEYILDAEGNRIAVPIDADENDLSWMNDDSDEE